MLVNLHHEANRGVVIFTWTALTAEELPEAISGDCSITQFPVWARPAGRYSRDRDYGRRCKDDMRRRIVRGLNRCVRRNLLLAYLSHQLSDKGTQLGKLCLDFWRESVASPSPSHS